MIEKPLGTATIDEINEEKEKFMAICFILRSEQHRLKKLLDNLKSSANHGKDEYPGTVTEAFDLLVRESGEYDGLAPSTNRYRGRGGPRGRGRHSYMFAQDGQTGTCTYTRTNNNST